MPIEAVFFDMGGTIETFWYDRALRLEKTPGLQAILRAGGVGLDLDDEQLYELVAPGLERYHKWSLQSLVELPPQRVFREFIFAGLALDGDRLDAIAEELMCYIETQYYRRDMRPEMPQVLEAIQKMGLKIGLISNVNSRGQVPLNLSEYNLRHYFDPIVLSSEYGYRKPDPAIFHYAARLANAPTSRCAYVGDRVARDIEGARRAGFGLAVQIRHDFDHGENDDGALPNAVIDSMTELLDILQTEAARPAPEPPANGIRAYLFDAGDILYHRPNRNKSLRTFLEQIGLTMQGNYSVQKAALAEQAYRGQITQRQYHAALVRMYGVTQPENVRQGVQILEAEDDDMTFFDGVPQTLLALKEAGYLLGIITDTSNSVHAKLRWFESGGFGRVWDTIISSKELGTRKPNAPIYAAALKQLGIGADQAIFVGHKISELNGAKAVGMHTVAFNYEAGATADCYVETFAELLTIADRITA